MGDAKASPRTTMVLAGLSSLSQWWCGNRNIELREYKPARMETKGPGSFNV